MFKKIFILVTSFFLFTSTAFAEISDNPTIYEATTNINIRNKPHVNGTRIGHFKKGERMEVYKKVGNWCKVSYKKYRSAYVYCPLLKKIIYVPKPKDISLNEFSLDYPSDWIFDTSIPYAVVLKSPSKNGKFSSQIISMLALQYENAESAKKGYDEFYNIYGKILKNPGTNPNINTEIEPLSIPVGNQSIPSYLITMKAPLSPENPDSTFSSTFIMTFAVKDNALYYVHAAIPNTATDEEIENVKKIMRSFKLF